MGEEEEEEKLLSTAAPFVDALVEQGFCKSGRDEMIQLPGSKAYEENRHNHFNFDMICKPLMFLLPRNTEQVSRAVRGYAVGLKAYNNQNPSSSAISPRLCICGGRHSTRTFQPNSVVMDLSQMKQVVVDAQEQTVMVEPGVKIGDLLKATAPHHLAPVTGTHTDTGVIGLTLGGGQGFLSKKFGPAVDQIVSAEIVLADGSVQTVTKDNPKDDDILFNIRGGGGNIGVVTKLTMKVYPIRNLGMLESLHFVFTQQGVQDTLVRYGEWSLATNDDCTSVIILPLRMPIVVSMGISCHSSIPQTVEAKNATINVTDIPGLAELKANALGTWFGLPAKFSVKDYCTQAMEETSKDPPGYCYYTNVFLPSITREIAAVVAEAQRGSMAKGISGVIAVFNHAGNKTAQVPTKESSFEMRDKKYWMLCQCTWKPTGNAKRDAAARDKVVTFSRWFRRAIIEAGAQKTIHAVTNQEQDYTPETDYGLFMQKTNKDRILRTQKALDPDGIFSGNYSTQ